MEEPQDFQTRMEALAKLEKLEAEALEKKLQQEMPSNSVFHPDNVGPVSVIQLSRIYDAIMALLAIVDPDKAVRMAEAHAKGIILMPPPAFAEDEDVLDSDA